MIRLDSISRSLALAACLATASIAWAGDPVETDDDAEHDQIPRRTDPGADGPLNPGQRLPDLLSISFSKWQASTPATDPFVGMASNGGIHLFRIDLEFEGLVNPPGPLYDALDPEGPFRYGPNPLIVFVEINVDRRTAGGGRETGGDTLSNAGSHYLANVARFGGLPSGSGSTTNRAVARPGDFDSDFSTSPQFERSGAEFIVKLCGCEALSDLVTSVPNDTVFSAGDVWTARGHFIERTSAFDAVSLMTCPPQRYAPKVSVRFAHSISEDHTTVSFVYALDQEGARQLAGLATVPPLDDRHVGMGCDDNEGSLMEALYDAAVGATAVPPNCSGIDLASCTMARGWAGRANTLTLTQYLDPTEWRSTVLVGTTYSRTIFEPSADEADYVWTDVGSGCARGDQTGDGFVTTADRDTLTGHIGAVDGTGADADGAMNGVLLIPGFGFQFDVADINYDGRVDCNDVAELGLPGGGGAPCCRADWNGINGVTVDDLFAFLVAWFSQAADFNGDGSTTLQDLFDYLVAYFGGCP